MKVISTEEASILEEGSWTEYDGSKLKIGPISRTSFQRKLNRLNQPYQKKIENRTIDPAITKRTTCQAMAGELLLDWDDTVVDSTGKSLEFNETNATQALLNDPGLREFVAEYAQNFDNFRKEQVEELGKA